MYDLYKTPKLIGQVLLVVFLLAVLGSQVVSAQTALPDCTESLIKLPEYAEDDDDVPQNMDIDKDDDGLIEICDLEGLHEIRDNLTGGGSEARGCPTGGCEGFELTGDLDFTAGDSYRTTANIVMYTVDKYNDPDDMGWRPIGSSLSNSFQARFEGNGHTISHLMVNRSTNDIGLFGVAAVVASITSIGLRDVRIVGNEDVGGLVGSNFGSITNSYATGSVSGNDDVGGLVGTNGGGSITNSYATGSVSGNNSDVGGLVGVHSGSITQSYAASTVTGVMLRVGGLVGWNSETNSSIKDSYATGNVSGNSNVGGLVGLDNGGSITNSYATGSVTGMTLRVGGLVGAYFGSITNSYATGIMAFTGFDGGSLVGQSGFKTLTELQTPTEAIGIYSDWDPAVWDFGTPSDLPTFKDPPEGIQIRAKVFLEGPLQ